MKTSRDPSSWRLLPFFLLAWSVTGCAAAPSSGEGKTVGADARADLAWEIEELVQELSLLAARRIPLGTVRLMVQEPKAVRSDRDRYRPANHRIVERRATQAGLRFQLEMALANRMNVVGALAWSDRGPRAPGTDSSASAQEGRGPDGTHALVTTFVLEDHQLDLCVQLVEVGSGWIVATAHRRVTGFEPVAYDEHFGRPAPRYAKIYAREENESSRDSSNPDGWSRVGKSKGPFPWRNHRSRPRPLASVLAEE